MLRIKPRPIVELYGTGLGVSLCLKRNNIKKINIKQSIVKVSFVLAQNIL